MLKSIFIVLSLADYILTCVALTYGPHLFYEANPLANWIWVEAGLIGLAFLKLFSIVAVYFCMLIVEEESPKVAHLFWIMAIIITSYIVWSGVYANLIIFGVI